MSIFKRFKDKGYRVTKQRRAILEILEECRGRHLSANDVYIQLIKRGVKYHMATIYRTLNLLEKEGLVHGTSFKEKHLHYELYDPYEIHFYCRGCKKVTEVENPLGKKFLEEIQHKIGKKFTVEKYFVIVEGLCNHCRREEESSL